MGEMRAQRHHVTLGLQVEHRHVDVGPNVGARRDGVVGVARQSLRLEAGRVRAAAVDEISVEEMRAADEPR